MNVSVGGVSIGVGTLTTTVVTMVKLPDPASPRVILEVIHAGVVWF